MNSRGSHCNITGRKGCLDNDNSHSRHEGRKGFRGTDGGAVRMIEVLPVGPRNCKEENVALKKEPRWSMTFPSELTVFTESSFSSMWAFGVLHSPGEVAVRHLRLWLLCHGIVLCKCSFISPENG